MGRCSVSHSVTTVSEAEGNKYCPLILTKVTWPCPHLDGRLSFQNHERIKFY